MSAVEALRLSMEHKFGRHLAAVETSTDARLGLTTTPAATTTALKLPEPAAITP